MGGTLEEFGIAVARAKDGTLWMSPAGDLDLRSAEEFVEAVRRAIEEQSPVLLDLRRLAFIDSRGLGAMVEASRIAKQAGISLKIGGGSPSFLRLADITGLVHIVEMVDLPPYEAPD